MKKEKQILYWFVLNLMLSVLIRKCMQWSEMHLYIGFSSLQLRQCHIYAIWPRNWLFLQIERVLHSYMNTEAMQNQYDHLMMSSSKSFCYCELLLLLLRISCLFEQTRWIHTRPHFFHWIVFQNNLRREDFVDLMVKWLTCTCN